MTSVLGLDSKEMTDVSELKGKWPRVREDFLFFSFSRSFHNSYLRRPDDRSVCRHHENQARKKEQR